MSLRSSSSGSLSLPHPTQAARRYATCSVRHKTVFDFVPVLFVFAMWGYTYVGFNVFYLHPMFAGTLTGAFRGSPITAIALGVAYHIVALFWLVSYVRTIFSDAGTVPEAFRLREGEAEGGDGGEDALRRSLGIESVIDVSGSELRVCRVCRLRKPPRTHHCSACKRCVVKMDHHCPWTGNCVAFGNYKFFVLFLFWTSFLGLFVAAALLPAVVTYSAESGSVHQLITFIMGLVFGLAIGAFFYSHVRLMQQNMTTLESLGSGSSMITITYGWNVGPLANVKQVLGNNYLLWLVPVATSTGDGISWPQRQESHSSLTAETDRLIDQAAPVSDAAV